MRKLALVKGVALVLSLVLLLASCSLLSPMQTTPETTESPVAVGSLAALKALFETAKPSTVTYTVVYTDPSVGIPLNAELSLSYDGTLGTLAYRYDWLNPIGSDEFISQVSDSVTGDLATLSAALSGAASWVWDDATGISLPDIRLEDAYLASAEITPSGSDLYLLTATPTEGNAGALVGLSFEGASDLVLQVSFWEHAVTHIELHYALGDADYSVTASFTYSHLK